MEVIPLRSKREELANREPTRSFLMSCLGCSVAAARENLKGSSDPCRLIPKPGATPLLS